jgi:hypothetical protein
MTNHAMRRPALTAALLMLAACGSGATNAANEATNAAPANEAAAPAAPTAPAAPATSAAPGAVTADYMLGKWSAMGEDCKDTIEFRKNGTVGTPIGDAKRTLTGDKLTVDYGEGSNPTPSTIKPLGPDRIEITTSSGRKETEKRC